MEWPLAMYKETRMKKFSFKIFACAALTVLALSNGFAQESNEEIMIEEENPAAIVPEETEEGAPVPAGEEESFEYSEEEY